MGNKHHRFQSKLYWLYFVTVRIGGFLPVNSLMYQYTKNVNAVSVCGVIACVGVAVVAAVPDVDDTAHLDTQDRETGHHREVVCATHVQQFPH